MRKTLFILILLAGSFTADAQSTNRKWFEGRLYHTNGEVFNGLISWMPPRKGEYEDGDMVLYRRDEMAEALPVPYYKVNAFIMGDDSIVVSHNVLFKNSPFMTVMLDNPTKLYTNKVMKNGIPLMINSGGFSGGFGMGVGVGTSIGGGVKTTYYYGKTPDNVIKLEKKQFIEVMSDLMADKPEVVAKIKDKTFRYGDMDNLVTYYLTGQMPKKSYDN
ncbi:MULTISPECIES: hypothetical protein [unclassified Mucilaginibacter]|uniref:hypothetical protein n=1 Tax=unclassified Mucilaginibacter TaxID=2617802 RepID=UPI002AC96295|nr:MULTISPECIES: hypothetical protein [unclassified Mucilaginibacter]MEB0260166.1 hypothetical protein [Mucilaginibacter sp. 10I4]MEB0277423.1 hypothetical protein [Mucilaginibacter sp. 10B2]MEB0300095.1 hypothetical protein [Mucilaginibacter sp. 5C4]WPX25547.1 hypothetical protein RHM67_09740 [Mucilaginibacter sp. 5C4]